MQKSSYAVFLAFALVAALVIPITSANAMYNSMPNSSEVKRMSTTQYQQVVNLHNGIDRAEPGYVVVNATIAEICQSNCVKISQVAPDLFATQATQEAKLLQTQKFLNETYATAFAKGDNSKRGDWCAGMQSVNPKFVC